MLEEASGYEPKGVLPTHTQVRAHGRYGARFQEKPTALYSCDVNVSHRYQNCTNDLLPSASRGSRDLFRFKYCKVEIKSVCVRVSSRQTADPEKASVEAEAEASPVVAAPVPAPVASAAPPPKPAPSKTEEDDITQFREKVRSHTHRS